MLLEIPYCAWNRNSVTRKFLISIPHDSAKNSHKYNDIDNVKMLLTWGEDTL